MNTHTKARLRAKTTARLAQEVASPSPDVRLSVVIPREMWEKLAPMLEERMLPFNDFLAVQLHRYLNAALRGTALKLTDLMPYGQYRGLRMEHIIRTDPRYVAWLLSQSESFELDDEGWALLDALGYVAASDDPDYD